MDGAILTLKILWKRKFKRYPPPPAYTVEANEEAAYSYKGKEMYEEIFINNYFYGFQYSGFFGIIIYF